MAEYYPLLARAVAGLPQSTPETRRAIYDRARVALIGQLRAVQPPIADEDIQRESRMLDEAIARLERETAGGRLPTPAPAPTPAAQSPAPAAAPAAAKPGAPMLRQGAQQPRTSLPPLPNLPPRPGATPVAPAPGAAPAPAPAVSGLEAARQRLASLAKMSSSAAPEAAKAAPAPTPGPAPASAPVPPAPIPPVAMPPGPIPAAVPGARPNPGPMQSVRPGQAPGPMPASGPAPGAPPFGRPGGPVPPVNLGQAPAQTPRPGPTNAEIAASRLAPNPAAERRDPAPPISVTLRKYGPRAEAAGVSADFSPMDDYNDEPRFGGVRPAAPLPPAEKTRNFRPLLIGLPVAVVVGAIAVFAYMRRDNPEDLARLRPAPGAEATNEQSVGKIVERIGGGQRQAAEQAPTQPQAPAQQTTPQQAPAQQAPAQQAPAQQRPAVPVSQRAALLVDAPEEPQRVRTFVGNVVWRLDNVSRGPGQPLTIGVRAEIDLPDAGLKAVVLIQKNLDETLPASHTMEVRFTPAAGGPIPGVAQISTPQMRKEDTPAGDPLAGVPAPILRNFFLVGLTRGDTSVARNIDLIRNRGWIDIPMLLSDQRIAKITFEKGPSGERVINEALDAWR